MKDNWIQITRNKNIFLAGCFLLIFIAIFVVPTKYSVDGFYGIREGIILFGAGIPSLVMYFCDKEKATSSEYVSFGCSCFMLMMSYCIQHLNWCWIMTFGGGHIFLVPFFFAFFCPIVDSLLTLFLSKKYGLKFEFQKADYRNALLWIAIFLIFDASAFILLQSQSVSNKLYVSIITECLLSVMPIWCFLFKKDINFLTSIYISGTMAHFYSMNILLTKVVFQRDKDYIKYMGEDMQFWIVFMAVYGAIWAVGLKVKKRILQK